MSGSVKRNNYIWFTVEINTGRPKAKRVIELQTHVR